MSLIPDEKGKTIVEYSTDSVFKAMNKLLNSKGSKFKIQKSDPQAHSFFIKSGASMTSWGETLQITINPSLNGSSEVVISSKSKFGLLDLGKNQENINDLISLLNKELNNGEYEKSSIAGNTSDIPDQIKKLSELKDAGIISSEEFESKKGELLSRM